MIDPYREWALYITVALLYFVVRLAFIPADAELTRAFSHDSGYLALVAENLVAGRGYVFDSLWLVFLLPTALPMPFHNANPLFPTLTAAATWISGDVFQSGFAIAAGAGAVTLAAVAALIRPVVHRPAVAVLLATAVVIFPPVLADSFYYLTDALCAAFVVGFLAVVRRAKRLPALFAGGVLLGLGWLTRGATILIAPALLVYLFLRLDPRVAVTRLAVVLLGAVLIVSPWLLHTKRTWGSYLRSDSGYALVQDLAARKSHQSSVTRFWHSTQEPPPLTAFILESPVGFATHVTYWSLMAAKRTLSWWSLRNAPVALVLLAAFLLFLLENRRWRSPEAAGVAVLGATTLLILGVRGDGFEERYVNTLTVIFAMCAVLGCWRAWQYRGGTRPLVIASLVLVWGVLIPRAVVQSYATTYQRNTELVIYREAAAEVDRTYAKGGPVVVGMAPYFYSLETRSPALNIPDASDDFLLSYMDRYQARHVFLTNEELQFWRPAWSSLSALPEGLRLAGTVRDGLVFERTGTRSAAAGSARR